MIMAMPLLRALSALCLVLQLFVLPPAAAQNSAAVCTNSTYSWTFNHENQSPCVVASYLSGECTSIPYNTTVGGPGQYYQGPSGASVTFCQCSSVVYNLFMACSLCQSGNIITYATWDANCAAEYMTPQGTWNQPIPANTSVPAWAYVTPDKMGGYFNPAVAKPFANSTESTATPSPTGSAAPTGSGGASSPPPSNKSHVGQIVGGVIGGCALILILIGSYFGYPKLKAWWDNRGKAPLVSTPGPGQNANLVEDDPGLAMVGDDGPDMAYYEPVPNGDGRGLPASPTQRPLNH